MTVKEILNSAKQANILIGNYMVWKHEQGWSAIKLHYPSTYVYEEDAEFVTDTKGRNYWTDIEKLFEHIT